MNVLRKLFFLLDQLSDTVFCKTIQIVMKVNIYPNKRGFIYHLVLTIKPRFSQSFTIYLIFAVNVRIFSGRDLSNLISTLNDGLNRNNSDPI